MDEAPEIFEVVANGDIISLRKLLRRDPTQVNAIYSSETPDQPLHGVPNFQVAELLLSYGAKINAKGDGDKTPLHYAAKKGLVDLVEWLVERGADINATDMAGWTPLYTAALGREPECDDVAELLLRHGASLDLHAALLLGRSEEARAMLKNNPSLISKIPFPESLLSEAVLFIEKKLDDEGMNASPSAIKSVIDKNKDIIELIIEQKPPKRDSYEALFHAVKLPHPEIARLLLEYGADAKPRSEPGMNLATVASASRCPKEMIELLARYGVEYDPDDFERLLEKWPSRL